MEKPPTNTRQWLKVVLPVLVLAAGYGVFRYMVTHPPEIAQEAVTPRYPTVEVVEANPKPVKLTVQSQGTVRPRSEMTLKPEVNGRVVWLSDALVNGGVFDKGEKLLEIDPTDYRTELASSKTTLTRAETELEHAQREYERIRSLEKRQLASDSEVDEVKRSLKLAKAEYQEAKIRLEQAEINLERTTIRAPFTGRVRSENVDQGQFLSRGEAIAHLYASDYYEVHLPLGIEKFTYLDIPPGTRGMLSEEEAPHVTLTGTIGANEFHWQGKLMRTEGEIHTDTRLVYGVVRVANTRTEEQVPLLVGMFVKASIEGRRLEDIVRLPRSALRDSQRVLVVDDESRLRYRSIDIARIQGDEVLVKGGLKQGETVCVTPLQVVTDGMRVDTATVEARNGK